MAGIYDRIKPAVEAGDRVSVHALRWAVFAVVDGTFTDQQVVNALNARLTTPLDASAIADLSAIRTQITNAANAGAKFTILERFDGLNGMVEQGYITSETVYRNKLGLI